jgi:hypothetical protein
MNTDLRQNICQWGLQRRASSRHPVRAQMRRYWPVYGNRRLLDGVDELFALLRGDGDGRVDY